MRGLPLRWRTRINVWQPPQRFVDEQIRGPYRQWIHEHTFEARAGGTLARDVVLYAVPFDFIAHPLFVRRDIEKIFAYRAVALRGRFATLPIIDMNPQAISMDAGRGGTPSGLRSALALSGWLLACFGAAAMGGIFMPGEWYASLKKPSWNPPGWVFGPVWTVLYAMMAVAAWLVWKRGGWSEQRKPLLNFLVQLALNALWTPLFFGLHRPGLAFAEIVLLWLAIAATIAAFRPVSRTAMRLLAPYLAWVSFAAALNFALWRLNT